MTQGFDAIRQRLRSFIETHVYPAEQHLPAPGTTGFERPGIMVALRREAEKQGLLHLFSSLTAAQHGFSTVELAHLAELTGLSPLLAQDAVGSLNPDAEIINLLNRFGTEPQKQRWLGPLVRGEISSVLCITEPDVASSDPTQLRTAVSGAPGAWLLDGEKHWALGGASRSLGLLVVLAVSSPDAQAKSRLSLILVPADRKGIEIGECSSYFGYRNEQRGGLASILFASVPIDMDDVLGPPGQGLTVVQTSLGPARLFHCMRLVGCGERALELTCQRLKHRQVRGRPLSENALWLDNIGQARVAIDQARAFALAVAAQIDAEGLETAATGISAVKATVPETIARVIDMAIQAHGSEGMSHSLPLAMMWSLARSLRFSDGPDEVHRMVVARAELRKTATR